MCFCDFEKAHPEEGVIEVPSRPIPISSNGPFSAFGHGGHSLSTLPRPNTRPLSGERLHLQPRAIEARRLASQDRVVLVETITPRSSAPTIHQREPRRSGSLKHAGGARHSGSTVGVATPRQLGGVIVAPRQFSSGVVPLVQASVLPSPTYTRRHSTTSFRGPRQSNPSLRSTSYRSTREKMAEVDEENGSFQRREYDRREDPHPQL